jgi:hypothetical protein
MRTPAAWPLHPAAASPRAKKPPLPERAAPPQEASPPQPETSPEAPRPLGPAETHKTAEPLLGRPAAAPSPNPPSLETILAATSFDKPTHRRGRVVFIAGLASLGVLVPCLVGAAILMMSPDISSLAPPLWGRTDKTASLPAPSSASISPDGGTVVASGKPGAPAQETREHAPPPERVAPPAPPVASSPASAPSTSPASEAVADAERRIAQLESDKAALASEVSRLQRVREAPEQTNSIPPPSESEPRAQAAVDAERRIAALESEKDALAAEVGRLQRDREAAEQIQSIPSPPSAAAVEQPESGARSQAAADAERRIASLESEKDALAAEVGRLQRDREAPDQTGSASPAATAIPAAGSTPEPSAALASLPEGMPARVLIRYPRNNADARRQAESLADALKRHGVEVADLRESDGAVRTGISFFYARDAATAQEIGALVGVAPTLRPQMRDGLTARPGAIEFSFSGDSHLAVITTSRKEPVHE